MSVDIYLMRHGETEANVAEILLGREDSPFTDAGWRQPIEVARQLDKRPLACIYASPMERTLRTARLVQEALGWSIEVKTETALAEIDAGEFTGLTFAQVRAQLSENAILGQFRYPGGESWAEVQRRAVEFSRGLEKRHPEKSVLLVTHAGVIAGLVAEYLGEPIEDFIRTRFGHDYLGRLTIAGGVFTSYAKIVGTVDSWV
jgi:broad specificity phosphatase PhoE